MYTPQETNTSYLGIGHHLLQLGRIAHQTHWPTSVREAMSELYVHQDEQVTAKKAPYLRSTHEILECLHYLWILHALRDLWVRH